jgi:hypothetical protein
MAKQTSAAAAVNVENLFKKVEALGSEVSGGIDALLREKAEAKAAYEKKADAIDEQVDRLNELYHSATGRYYVSSKRKVGDGVDNGKTGEGRKRRGEDDLKADAEKLADAIKAAGKDGATGSALKQVAKPMAGQSIKDFVEKYTDYKIKTTGERAQMRYHIG